MNQRIGIYYIKIAEKYFIGRDIKIDYLIAAKDKIRSLVEDRCSNEKLTKEFKKHGKDSIEYGIIETIEPIAIEALDDATKYLSERETYWIETFNSYENGMNTNNRGIYRKKGNASKDQNGIYYLDIGDKRYIGKDSHINLFIRAKQHIAELKRGNHYNSKMQIKFNEVGEANCSYGVLESFEGQISDKELYSREKYWVEEFNTIEEGLNLIPGGSGSNSGVTGNKADINGSNNPASKISLEDFKEIVEMFKNGKKNVEVAKRFGLDARYVSLIRNKRRYQKWFEIYFPDYEVVTGRKFQTRTSKNSIEDSKVIDIYKEILKGRPLVQIAKEFSVSESQVSGIKNKKHYDDITDKYDKELKSK